MTFTPLKDESDPDMTAEETVKDLHDVLEQFAAIGKDLPTASKSE